jgi:hypothetical protein
VIDVLNISGITEGEMVEIYDIQGRLVLRQNFHGTGIRTERLSAGIYFLKCKDFNPVKILKQ